MVKLLAERVWIWLFGCKKQKLWRKLWILVIWEQQIGLHESKNSEKENIFDDKFSLSVDPKPNLCLIVTFKLVVMCY